MALPKVGDHAGIHREAAEIVQQHSAMRRSIGTDALEADEIVIAKIFGRSLAGGIDRAVVEQAAGCRDYGDRTKAELRTLTPQRASP